MNAIPLLLKVFDVKSVAARLRSMLEWIQGPVNEHDRGFASFMENILMDQPGIVSHAFNLPQIPPILFMSLCDFPGENYINDDIINNITHLFDRHYGMNDRYLFIPHWILHGWQGLAGAAEPDWEWGREKIKKRRSRKSLRLPIWNTIGVYFA